MTDTKHTTSGSNEEEISYPGPGKR